MKQAGMTLEKAQLILENEAPSCGRKLTFTSEERYEAYRMGIKALEKQIPKRLEKQIYYMGEEEIVCPICGNPYVANSYCDCCGQAIDWSEEKNE